MPGLVVGSISPDAGYAMSRFGLDVFSHQFLGSVVFCLPVGLVLVVLFNALRSRLGTVPSFRVPPGLLAGELWRLGSLWSVVGSILLGAWTHVFWDAFTNQHGWFVLRFDLLRVGVASVGYRTVRFCHLLWYASSFLGIFWLCRAYEKSRLASLAASSAGGQGRLWLTAILVASLVLPMGLLHHLLGGLAGMALVALASALSVIGGIWAMDRAARIAVGGSAREEKVAGLVDKAASWKGAEK
jgi:hypothetical protein